MIEMFEPTPHMTLADQFKQALDFAEQGRPVTSLFRETLEDLQNYLRSADYIVFQTRAERLKLTPTLTISVTSTLTPEALAPRGKLFQGIRLTHGSCGLCLTFAPTA
ncbi:MAG: hypothetical protein WAX89_06635 [Alphaproteobacteria bacterium]